MVRSALLLLLLASPTATSLRVASNGTAPLRSRAGHAGGGSAATTGGVRTGGQPCGSATGHGSANSSCPHGQYCDVTSPVPNTYSRCGRNESDAWSSCANTEARCSSDADCKALLPGTTCYDDVNCGDGVCAPRGKEKEDCNWFHPCADGLACMCIGCPPAGPQPPSTCCVIGTRPAGELCQGPPNGSGGAKKNRRASTAAGAAAEQIPLFRLFEMQVVNSNTSVANKYRDVWLNATFSEPSSPGREIPFFGFYDGADKNVWKLRFMPNVTGRWSYRYSFSDGSMAGGGEFDCVLKGQSPGVMMPFKQNPHWFSYGGDKPVPTPAVFIPQRREEGRPLSV